MSLPRRLLPPCTLAFAIVCLYFFKLSGFGAISPDEPRYLAIGRAMASTHDYVTPRLWGNPWFEKPPLLYWLIGTGSSLGLGPELSGRLPIAVLSVGFLLVLFFLVREEFGSAAAAAGALLLGTSAAWICESTLALTDLPLAVFYSLAVLLALPLLRGEAQVQTPQAWRFLLIGASLGLAALAKGLVPIALAVPFFWFLRRWWRSWFWAIAALLAVALPWYLLVYARNGRPFLYEFLWKHHVERLYSTSLQHVQPVWYYLPVLLLTIFPWSPLLVPLAFSWRDWDERKRFLAACILFGLVFFSIPVNKLPGYLLPLVPSLFVLLGASINFRRLTEKYRALLFCCAVLVALVPPIARMLPAVLEAGRLTFTQGLHLGRPDAFFMAAPLAVLLWAKRSWAGILLVLCLVANAFFLKIVAAPVIDRSVSSRQLWLQIKNVSGTVCDDWINRDWQYGLAFYRGRPYPICDYPATYDFALRERPKQEPVLVPIQRKPKTNK